MLPYKPGGVCPRHFLCEQTSNTEGKTIPQVRTATDSRHEPVLISPVTLSFGMELLRRAAGEIWESGVFFWQRAWEKAHKRIGESRDCSIKLTLGGKAALWRSAVVLRTCPSLWSCSPAVREHAYLSQMSHYHHSKLFFPPQWKRDLGCTNHHWIESCSRSRILMKHQPATACKRHLCDIL